MTAHTTGQLHSQSWDLPLVQFQTENSSFPTTLVQLLRSIFNISSTKLKFWFCLIAWTWSKTDPILPVVLHVLFSWRNCHILTSQKTTRSSWWNSKQNAHKASSDTVLASTLHPEMNTVEKKKTKVSGKQPRPCSCSVHREAAQVNSPEQKDPVAAHTIQGGHRDGSWQSLLPLAQLPLQHCLECEPQPKDGSFRPVHFLLASKSQRESAQLGFDRNRGFLREGKELPYVEKKPLRVQLWCSAQLHSEPLRALGSSREILQKKAIWCPGSF